MAYENILVERHDRVGLIRLNRPKALNALSRGLVADVNAALSDFEADDGIGAIVITGSEKAFCAGADIREVSDADFVTAYRDDPIVEWDRIADVPQAAHRGGRRLRARRRLRDRHDVRHHPCRRHREVRTAGDHARHPARRRRHAAADPPRRPGQGDGALPDRPADRRRRRRSAPASSRASSRRRSSSRRR